MIYLTPGITASLWFSLREVSGPTTSFTMTMTNDISGEVKTINPVDLQPDNKWSRFDLVVGKPENLPLKVNMGSGMWSFTISNGSTIIERGKMVVEEAKSWNTLTKSPKNNKVLKR